MTRIARTLTLASLTVLTLGAGLVAGFAATHTVTIDSTLHPATLTITSGDSVTWANEDTERHRMRSRTGPVEFDSNDLEPGDSFTFAFTVAGTYPYLDERDDENTQYHGTIVVETADGGGAGGGTGGGSGRGSGGVQAPTSAGVRIVDKTFTPGTVTIATGGTVTWSNDDDTAHTVNASAGGFASGTMSRGEKYTRAFPSAGTFLYFCAIHTDMRGTIKVQRRSGVVPPPKPSAGGNTGTTGTAAKPPATAPGESGVAIVDFAFNPSTVAIRPGDAVIWANRGRSPHTVTAEDGAFDSGFIDPGKTFRRVFATEGSYAYVCALHPTMTATVLVGGASAPASEPTAADGADGAASSGSAVPGRSDAPQPSAREPVLAGSIVVGMVLGIPAMLGIGAAMWWRRSDPTADRRASIT